MATIIGKVEHGFIVTIHEDELAKLLGYHYESSMPAPDRYKSRFNIGDTVEIAKMFHHLRDLASAGPDLRKTATSLRVAADLIDTLPNPLTQVNVGPDAATVPAI